MLLATLIRQTNFYLICKKGTLKNFLSVQMLSRQAFSGPKLFVTLLKLHIEDQHEREMVLEMK